MHWTRRINIPCERNGGDAVKWVAHADVLVNNSEAQRGNNLAES